MVINDAYCHLLKATQRAAKVAQKGYQIPRLLTENATIQFTARTAKKTQKFYNGFENFQF